MLVPKDINGSPRTLLSCTHFADKASKVIKFKQWNACKRRKKEEQVKGHSNATSGVERERACNPHTHPPCRHPTHTKDSYTAIELSAIIVKAAFTHFLYSY